MRRRTAILTVGIVLFGLATCLLIWRAKKSSSQARSRHVISIESTPQGAHIWINRQPLGDTPFHVEELFVGEVVTVRVSRPGFRPWNGSFLGDEPVKLNLVLERLPPSVRRDGPVADAGALQRAADEIEARRLGGSLDDNGQFVDPEIEAEMQRVPGTTREEPRKHPVQVPTTPPHP